MFRRTLALLIVVAVRPGDCVEPALHKTTLAVAGADFHLNGAVASELARKGQAQVWSELGVGAVLPIFQ